MNIRLAILGLCLVVMGLTLLVGILVINRRRLKDTVETLLLERRNLVLLYAYSLDLRLNSIGITQMMCDGFFKDAELLNDVHDAFTKVQLAAASSSDDTLKAMAPGMGGILKVMKDTVSDRNGAYQGLSEYIADTKNNADNRKAYLYRNFAEIMKEYDEEISSHHAQDTQKN